MIGVLTNKKRLKNYDYVLLIDVILIMVFGILNVYSTTYSSSGFKYAELQSAWFILGLGVVIALAMVDYSAVKNYSSGVYWVSVILLLYNDVTSKAIKGASSWIKIGSRAIEPGEFVRIGLVLMLAKKVEDMDGDINDPKNLMVLMWYSIIPMFLIVIQPNIGLTLICLFISFGMLFISGINLKLVYGSILASVPLALVVWFSGILKAYQKDRILSFLNPDTFQQDTGYQLFRSLIGIGSGGVLGKGFLKASLISSGFIPEVHTDFIFAAIGDQWGFVGAIFLLLLYGILIFRLIKLAKETEQIMARLVCVGVASSFIFSIFQNIGMTIGIMPIAGITLPFISYGGSSILANLISVGLALSVGMKKTSLEF